MEGDMEKAKIIYEQLGPMALALIGARDFVASEDSLSFSIKGSRRANKIRISVAFDDTYTVEFSKFKRSTLVLALVSQHVGVYVDQLLELIESETGLYTRR
jgi:hypothetical protein